MSKAHLTDKLSTFDSAGISVRVDVAAEIHRLTHLLEIAKEALRLTPKACNTMYRGNDTVSVGQRMRDALAEIEGETK